MTSREFEVATQAMQAWQFAQCSDGGAPTLPPYYLIKTDYWLDGGTIGITLADKDGSMLRLCFDHRIDTKTDGRIYIGCTLPEGAQRMLEPGSRSDKAMVALLKDVLGGLRADRNTLRCELEKRRAQ